MGTKHMLKLVLCYTGGLFWGVGLQMPVRVPFLGTPNAVERGKKRIAKRVWRIARSAPHRARNKGCIPVSYWAIPVLRNSIRSLGRWERNAPSARLASREN